MSTTWKNCRIPGATTQLEDAKVRYWASIKSASPYENISPYMNPQDFMETDAYHNANARYVQNGFFPLPPQLLMPMFQIHPSNAGTHMRSRI